MRGAIPSAACDDATPSAASAANALPSWRQADDEPPPTSPFAVQPNGTAPASNAPATRSFDAVKGELARVRAGWGSGHQGNERAAQLCSLIGASAAAGKPQLARLLGGGTGAGRVL